MSRKGKRLVCIIPNCGRREKRRGLCEACYRQVRLAIEAGKTTDAKLVKRGLLLPKRRNPFVISFENAK